MVTDTATTPSEQHALWDASARSYLWRKLFSLSGVVPIGVFVLVHLWGNARALQGRDAYGKMIGDIASIPFVAVLEVLFIILPLLFHAGFGLKLALDASYNVQAYGYSRNWMFVLQRITGVVALAFIAYHLYELRWQRLAGTMEEAGLYDALCRDLSGTVGPVPVVALVYLIGIGAVAFHFANGIWGFLVSWGITITRRSQRLAGTVLGVVGLLLFVLGANTTVYFATGTKLFIPPEIGRSRPSAPPNCPGSALESSAVQPAASSQPR